ncbi:MAG TPA: hypothetical protein VGR06_20995 [Actinophytocola sp.]|uniref:hypothetical protein n=1 Tax=Actinophytocola sp. TaxID=1872138 RepID=UPI002E05FE44|nr:hypothetical protein [Actinophytocola sp.]
MTSFISAEEFVLTQNRGEAPLDPFARQCYAEVVQSLIFFDEVLVPHPTRLDPRPEDYGPQPRMLQFLFELGIVRPLTFTSTDATVLDSAERALFDTLESKGAVLLSSYIDTTTSCDREQQSAGATRTMLEKIASWSNFQDGKVRQATLARSLRYEARARVKQIVYQAHPVRRDFCITFDLVDGGASDQEILDVIRQIRGIHHPASGPAAPARTGTSAPRRTAVDLKRAGPPSR